MLEDFKREVCEANYRLVSEGLVTLTWGNVSGYDRYTDTVAIKPSGVPYDELKPQDIVLLDLDGNVLEGRLRPSSDTATHCLIYKAFKDRGVHGICHTHSFHATMFAQANKPLRCMGTTHADHFYGTVPVTRQLTEQEVNQSYEANTGRVIIETFRHQDIDAKAMPAVLVGGHAPFTWGKSADDAVDNAIALEAVAQMNLGVHMIDPNAEALPQYVLEKHHSRKHGPDAYYGQT